MLTPEHWPDLLRDALNAVSDGVYVTDPDRIVTYWSPSAERISGYQAHEVVGRSCADAVLRHISESGDELCVSGCPLTGVCNDGKIRKAAVYLHHRDGHRLPVKVTALPIRDGDGDIAGVLEVFHVRGASRFASVTPGARSDDAWADHLTGLGTRRYGDLMLDLALEDAGTAASLGVLFVDCDEFKEINDHHGHLAGDLVLRALGRTVASAMRASDTPIRWGGDEFMAILPGVTPHGLAQVGERIRMLSESTWLETRGGTTIRATVSVGGAMARVGEVRDDVVERADAALLRAKRGGRNQVVIG